MSEKKTTIEPSDEKEITQHDLLRLLKQAGRTDVTRRQLTQWRSDNLLPPLRHITQLGSNRAMYVWPVAVIEQAKAIDDLKVQGYKRAQIAIALWLDGYVVPVDMIVQYWLRPVDDLLQGFTNGAHDPDDIQDHISTILVQYATPSWRFSPKPDPVIRGVGIEAWQEFMEFLFDLLAVPSFEPDDTLVERMLSMLQKLNTVVQTEGDPEETLDWILVLRDVFTLPHYWETLRTATDEEWIEARKDYRQFCVLLRQIAALFPRRNAQMTFEIRRATFLKWGFLLPPLLLAVRHAGYGTWIEDKLAFLNDFLDVFTDPEIGEILARL